MRLHSIALRNIRSYLSEKIEFPKGKVLLCGDIGSGKSTILLAIEFALFGIKKGELLGSSLLRNGKREGNVELKFSIGENDYLIKRALKRYKDGVKQETGYLMTNDLKKEGTATELRAWILEILGYPKDLLAKGKDLIYRYTVYTPQEEMKKILVDDTETRLDTLRRVFQIDKYKRIRENAQILTKHLREQIKKLEGRTATLQDNRKQKEMLLKDSEGKKTRLKTEEESHKRSLIMLKDSEAAEQKLRKDIEEHNRLKEEFERNSTDVQSILNQSRQLQQEADHLEKHIEPVKEIPDAEKIQAEVSGLKEKMAWIEKEQQAIQQQLGEMKGKESNSNEIITSFEKLDNCPTCLQEVKPEYKKGVIDRESQSLTKLKTLKESLDKKNAELIAGKERLEKDIETARKRLQEIEVTRLKAKQNKERKELAER
ncbi:MAG: SMC family ATPase, partial [Nanoarchaeota archaeon]|nr:SMC family ATPase [Nanoarchaeota archaeon]